jgi:tellurite resistance protein
MANRYIPSKTATVELTAHDLNYRDEEVMQGLVTAGALMALADGEVKTVERAELVNFVDRQEFVPTISQANIAETFDSRVRELEGRYCANVIVETLRPLTGQSLASVVVRTAQRVAAADKKILPSELQALRLLRRIMINLPAIWPDISMATYTSPRNSAECEHCGAVLIFSAWSESVAPQGNFPVRHCPICGHEIETTENRVEEKLSDELSRAFFPSLLIA